MTHLHIKRPDQLPAAPVSQEAIITPLKPHSAVTTMGRPSSSSDASTHSTDASTVYSYTKEPTPQDQTKRRSLRQKARDVLSDMGSPPTKRQDASEGKHTSNFAELGLMSGTQQTHKI